MVASVEPWKQSSSSNAEADQDAQPPSSSYLVATGADKQLHLFKTAAGHDIVHSFAGQSDSPILSYAPVRNGRYFFLTNMSGQLILQRGADVLGRRKDHSKYAIKVVAYEDADTGKVLVATAGWDSKICVYAFDLPAEPTGEDTDTAATMGEPVAYINLTTNPESMLFVRHVDLGRVVLLVSRRDSTHLYYYQVDDFLTNPTSSPPSPPKECRLLGKQNLAPHSNA